MAKVKIKFSKTTASPPSLDPGEVAYSEASDTLFIGASSGAIVKIGGNGAFATDTEVAALIAAAIAAATQTIDGGTF